MGARRNVLAYGVLGILLLGTGIIAAWVERDARREDDRRFQDEVERVRRNTETRMDAYVLALQGARALFLASNGATRDEFRRYVTILDIRQRLPGIQGVGFAALIPRDQRDARERAVRAQGFPSYRIWPGGERPFYSAIELLEPFDYTNQRAFGYDMFSEPVRHAAMERAWKTGQPALSARVVLVQETGPEQQPGFLLYVPVYERPTAGAGLLGWVYSPFRAPDLFRALFPQPGLVDFEVYDGRSPDPSSLLYDHDPQRAAAGRGRLHELFQLDVAGEPWTVAVAARPEFFRESRRRDAVYALAFGVLISLLLFSIVRTQTRARVAAEEHQRRAAFLADSGRILAQSLEFERTLHEVADLCVRSLADACVISLVTPEGAVRAMAATHRDPEMTQWAKQGEIPTDPSGATGVMKVIRTAIPELVPVVDERRLLQRARTPEQEAMLRKAAVRSFMCVPLLARGRIFGAISFISSRPGQFGRDDLATAEDLARLASAAVDNARLYSQAQEAIRLRDEFLSIASHELKTPLTSLALKVHSLRRLTSARAPDALDRTAKSLDVLERQIQRLTRLINSLLDVSRIAAGRLRLELTEMDLSALVREVVAAVAEEATLAECPVALEADQPILGRWDRGRLEQVIANLLSNAIKYGRGKPVHLKVEASGDSAGFTIRDEGIGIAREDLARLFEPFERAVPATQYGGLGLGLYISRQIVEALGGTIRVQSESGEGAVFIVELPRSGPPGAAPEQAKADPAGSRAGAA